MSRKRRNHVTVEQTGKDIKGLEALLVLASLATGLYSFANLDNPPLLPWVIILVSWGIVSIAKWWNYG